MSSRSQAKRNLVLKPLALNMTCGDQEPKMNSPRRRPMRFLASALMALVGLAALPSLASALTITVDDDRAQCPLADETTLTAAVAAAANGDTVKVCAGTYAVPGGPAPSSGLKIEKNISIAGAGADKVFVEPVQGTESMAQATPNPRDEYGNVITVRRRLIELYDVSISGLTVRAGNVPVEAGITMTDVVTGTISGVKVEGIVPGTGPGTGAFEPPATLADHGQGIVVANTIERTSNVTTIVGSSVSGFNSTGILVDNRLLSGAGQVTNESFVTAKIANMAIAGAGASSPIGQTGVEAWGSGARVQITKSKISGVGKADASAAAVELHGVDLVNSVVGGSEANGNDLTENLYGATNVAYDGGPATAALNATANFWGTTVSADPTPVPLVGANVTTAPVGVSAPAAPTIAAVVDSLPTAQWDTNPDNGTAVPAGVAVPLAVVAGDDFGVKQVEFKANGTSLGVAPTPALLGERVYTGSWTPSEAQAGSTVAITAVVTDSGGQTSQIALNIIVEGKPKFTAPPALTGLTSGYATIGKGLTCIPGTTTGYPAPTYSYGWTVNGVAAGTATNTYTPVAADSGKKIVCSVTATNKLGQASQASGQALVASVPKFASATKLAGFTGSFALVGQTLTCAAGAATGDPEPTLSYVWKRGEVTLPVTISSYTVAGIDVGSAVSCTITATSAGGAVGSAASVNVGAAPTFAGTAGTIGGSTSGYATIGKTLTCTTGNPSGFPVPTVTYVWKADDVAVGTSASYVPGLADEGKAITCTVKLTNSLGSTETTGAAAKVATGPTFSASAEVSGASGLLAKVEDPLLCTATAAGDPVPALGYQWLRDGAAIAGANAYTYTVEAADEGHELTCEVTASNLAGVVTSSDTVGVGGPPSGGLPTLSGATKVGSVLSCATGTWAGIPKPAFTYQWLRNGAPIAGATAASYTTTLADVGGKVTCEVTASNELGATKATSAELTVAAAPADAAPKAGGGLVSGKFAAFASVSCDLGPCTVAGPKEVKVKIAGVTYKVKLVYPGTLASGATGVVKLKLSKAAKAALAKAGKSAKFTVKLAISGGGSSANETFSLSLKAPKK